jgi:cytochrome P450
MSPETKRKVPVARGAECLWATEEFSPWDERITNENIWDIYSVMRSAGPVIWSTAHGGFWCVTQHAEVRAGTSDFRRLSSNKGIIVGRKKEVQIPPLEMDRPEHTRFRKVMQEPFLRKEVRQLEGKVRHEVRQLLRDLEPGTQFDIVHDLAAPLPLRIISDLLGIPRGERQDRHQSIADALVFADRESAEIADAAYHDFMAEEVADRRQNPGVDFLSVMANAEVDGERFTDEELTRMGRSLALAGHHTTINGISSMLIRMSDPELRAAIAANVDISSEQIVTEALRIDPPIHLAARMASEDLEMGGQRVQAGDTVALVFASANHDEQRYQDPREFLPDRVGGPPHLAFGHGIHKCLGEHLSILEMRVMLEEVLQAIPSFELLEAPTGTGMVYGHHMGWSAARAIVN